MAELTPEERQRIYEEERARHEAEQSAPAAGERFCPGMFFGPLFAP